MADSIIMERVADAAAECFYAELVKTEDLGVGLRGPGRRRHVKDRRGRLAPLHRAVRRGARRQHAQGLERARARRSHAGHAGERDRVRPDRLPRRVRAQVGPRGRAAGHTAARQGLAVLLFADRRARIGAVAQDGRGLCGRDRGGAGPLQKRRPVPDLRRRRRRYVPGARLAHDMRELRGGRRGAHYEQPSGSIYGRSWNRR